MKLYRRSTYLIGGIAILFGGLAILLHFACCGRFEFWSNFCLSIFGSAVLSIITSLLMYFHEREKTLESFLYHTKQILKALNKYQKEMPLEQKIAFFLDYHDLDKTAWDADFGGIHFFFDKLTKNRDRAYIYDKIYSPIVAFNEAVANHVWHFRYYQNGTGLNDKAIELIIAELEGYLITYIKERVPAEVDQDGNPIRWVECSSTSPKLVHKVREELYGHYYDLMYKIKGSEKKDTAKSED